MLNLSENKLGQHVIALQKKSLSLQMVDTPKSGKTLSRVLLCLFIAFVILMFIPWQQNINGKGQLTALAPSERPQTLQSPIGGRIEKWHKQEGDYVKKGDTIITISEIKEKYLGK
jgi:multidrug efflux pump subunit AcrA (membrane-fusion protein)